MIPAINFGGRRNVSSNKSSDFYLYRFCGRPIVHLLPGWRASWHLLVTVYNNLCSRFAYKLINLFIHSFIHQFPFICLLFVWLISRRKELCHLIYECDFRSKNGKKHNNINESYTFLIEWYFSGLGVKPERFNQPNHGTARTQPLGTLPFEVIATTDQYQPGQQIQGNHIHCISCNCFASFRNVLLLLFR